MKLTKDDLMDQFEEKWRQEEGSGFLSPMLHMDDVMELIETIENLKEEDVTETA